MSTRLEQLNVFLSESPEDPFLHYAIAQEYHKYGDAQLALEKYQYLISEHPQYVATYYHYGALLSQLKQKENALEILSKGILIAKGLGDSHSLSELQSAKLNLEIADDDDD
jgi:tetratricopeptide (TPR) repeat protein